MQDFYSDSLTDVGKSQDLQSQTELAISALDGMNRSEETVRIQNLIALMREDLQNIPYLM